MPMDANVKKSGTLGIIKDEDSCQDSDFSGDDEKLVNDDEKDQNNDDVM